MSSFLGRMYAATEKNRLLYPFYMIVRLLVMFPRLVSNEGVGGAIGWVWNGAAFVARNLAVRGTPEFFERPINTFKSKLGFDLKYPIEYVMYNEIFLDRCYNFRFLKELLERTSGNVALDFGVHHGMFINFLKTLKPSLAIYGAELNPLTFTKAQPRFSKDPSVKIVNVGIGGFSREVEFSLEGNSTQQSMYSTGGGNKTKSRIVTPVEFAEMNNIQASKIAVFKIDIEGAEEELFNKMESVQPLFERSDCIIMEIHLQANVKPFTIALEKLGFRFVENREINYFFAKSALLNTIATH